MRTVFLALMITLLPLRGWVGDVMAMDMASQSMAVAQPQAHHAHADMSDCPQMQGTHGHAAVLPATDHQDAHASDACSRCSACQICHSVALAPMLPLLPTAAPPMATPASGQPLYASAERTPGFKPPIL